jgi:hypothetical protein
MARHVGQELAAVQQLGRRVARRFIERGPRPKPSDLAAEMNVEVIHLGSPPSAQPRLRSEYTARPGSAGFSLPRPAAPRITLYTDSITALANATHASQRFDMMRVDLTELHIAHELFHHLESGQRFGPLTREEVETAAHAFAKELMDLDFEPEELSALLG